MGLATFLGSLTHCGSSQEGQGLFPHCGHAGVTRGTLSQRLLGLRLVSRAACHFPSTDRGQQLSSWAHCSVTLVNQGAVGRSQGGVLPRRKTVSESLEGPLPLPQAS